ncbi:TPA: hypothetical protein HA265_03655 [Candidatus Woesearchaeota archaeon]|nr:hypothetical protein [Candidatus Woesearchaeota archaeon]
MQAMTLVWIALAVVILVLFFRFVKRLFNVALSAVGIIFVVWLVVLGLRYADKTNLRNNLIASNNLFLLEDSNDLVTGFATDGTATEQVDISSLPDPSDSSSEIYDKYYKVIVVQKDALPEKIGLVYDSADADDRLSLFRSYIDSSILGSDDPVDTLIEKEQEGDLEVHRNTMAFRYGIREVLGL